MKVLIIQPSHRSNVKLFKKSYMSQLTLPVIASHIPASHEVRIIDENVEAINFSTEVDVVCITAMTPAATRAYEIATEFRKRGVKVLMGGVHVSAVPDEASQYADAIVVGEAEGLFPAIFEDLEKGTLKPIYKLSGKPDMANFPLPRHDLMSRESYVNIPKVETSRGCPFTCEFCSTTEFFGNKMRYRPVEDVIAEVKAIGTDFIFFTDNNIIGNPKYAKKLFKELKKTGIHWISQCSINFAKDDELLSLASDSGCVGMLIGFESLSEKAISQMGKKVNRVHEYAQGIKKIHKAGIGIIGCFVLGFDEDDEDVYKKTVKFIRKTSIEMPQLTVLTPFPGTALRTRMEKENRVLHSLWEYYDATHLVFQPKWTTVKEMRQRYDWTAGKIYSYRALLWRMFKSLIRYRNLYKTIVFWQVNTVYRRLWSVSVGHNDHLIAKEQAIARLKHTVKAKSTSLKETLTEKIQSPKSEVRSQ